MKGSQPLVVLKPLRPSIIKEDAWKKINISLTSDSKKSKTELQELAKHEIMI
jgi:hypothetical protein